MTILELCGLENPEQIRAVLKLYLERAEPDRLTLHEFVRALRAPTYLNPYVGYTDCRGVFYGIESDGYTHT